MSDAEKPPEPAEEKSPAARSGAYNLVLGNRDFRLYLLGRLAATIGQQMLVTAVLWEIYDRTHAPLALGFVGLTQMVPMLLFTLPAGHMADNYSRKKIIVLMTLVFGCMSLVLTFVSAIRADVVWIYLCLLVMGSARTFLWAATASFMPYLVDRKDFHYAVNWNATMFEFSTIVGPTVAGAVITLAGHHAAPVYVLTALGALTCCVLMMMVRRHHVVAIREKMTFKGLLTGFRFVFATRIISGIITLDMFAVLLGGATALLPVYAKDILHVGPLGLGFLQSAMPMGAVLCTFILAHRGPLQKAGRDLLWAVAAFGVATIAFGLSRWFWFSFLMLFACGSVDNISVVVRHTLVQLLTPDEKRGRVSAVNNLFIGTSNEMGGFESGAVAQFFGPGIRIGSANLRVNTNPVAQALGFAAGNSIVAGAVTSVVSGGMGTILVVIAIALLWPEVRKYGRLDAA